MHPANELEIAQALRSLFHDQWRSAEVALRQVKREEMAAMTDADAIAAFNALGMPPQLFPRFLDRLDGRNLVNSSAFLKRHIPIKHVFEAAFQLQTVRESRTYKFGFIGALPLQPLGEPRITVIVELTLLIVLGKEVDFVNRAHREISRAACRRGAVLRSRIKVCYAGVLVATCYKGI